MEIKKLRAKDGRFCQLEIKLEDGRLSICGSSGSYKVRAAAKREALAYWESFFDDQPGEIILMNKRFGKRFTSARGAARFVLETEGEFHGMDVLREAGNKVYMVESCGQIRNELAEWFPEVKPLLKYHLNDMHDECEHQEARGENWQTHPSAKCADCGYVLGSQWLKRDLPSEIKAKVEALTHLGEEVPNA